MEAYRHALYRYSTGSGFSPTVNVPERAGQVASFKGKPLLHMLITSEARVEIAREADRVSMQLEDAMRQIKNLAYNPALGNDLTLLKKRVEIIRKLMSDYPIRFVLRPDLEAIYAAYVNKDPSLDALIAKIVDYNKVPGAFEKAITTGTRVNRGYNLFDQFGRKLDKQDKATLKADKPAGTLLGFEGTGMTLASILGICLLLFIGHRVLFR